MFYCFPFFFPSVSLADTWPGECTEVQYKIKQTVIGNHDYGYTWSINSFGKPVWSDFVFHDGDWDKSLVTVYTFMYELSKGHWSHVRTVTLGNIDRMGEGKEVEGYTLPTSSCSDPCQDDKDQAEIVCGTGNVIIENEETCEFHCAGCDNEYQILFAQCGGEGTFTLNNETCAGHCTPTGDCTEEYEQKVISCGGADKIKEWNNEECTGECWSCKDSAVDCAEANFGPEVCQ